MQIKLRAGGLLPALFYGGKDGKKNKPAVPVGVRRRAGTDPKEDEAMQDGLRCRLSQKDGN